MKRSFLYIVTATLFFSRPLVACHDGSPLVLDLDGNGVFTSHFLFDPVVFDIDADGNKDSICWTNPHTEEGFLSIDINRNGTIDNGGELFGDASSLPTGEEFDNGFDALAVYDRSEQGGNQDGQITREDTVWQHLRIWVDKNHDGISQTQEMRTLDAWRIASIGLGYLVVNHVDGNLNSVKFLGTFQQRLTPNHLREMQVVDVFFRIEHHD